MLEDEPTWTKRSREHNGALVDEPMARYKQSVVQVVKRLDFDMRYDVSAVKIAGVHATSVPDAIEGGDETHELGDSGTQA